jgi:hypothetical protein
MTQTGKSFQVTHFEIGSEGHDPGDPLVALPPDPSLTETPGRVFGPEPVDGTGSLSPTCPFWNCDVQRPEAVGAIVSSISLVATIIDNGNDPVNEVGTTFIYSIANFPRILKTSADLLEFQVGVQA